MSQSSQSPEPVTAERDGITVTKRLLTDAFPVPTVEFELTSTRDEPVEVLLREYVPDGYSLETIGFHSDFESEHWNAYQDNRIEFERTIDPDETVRTIYGLRLEEEADVGVFMGDFELVSVGSVSSTVSTEPVDATTSPEAPIERTIDLDDLPDGAVAAALAAEFRDGSADEADREAIQEALDLDLSNSAEAQFRQLQTRVEDLIGYTDLIEEFLDDGGPKERFDALDERLDELTEAMDELREEVPDQEDFEAVQSRIDSLEEVVDDIDAWRGQLGEMFVKKEE